MTTQNITLTQQQQNISVGFNIKQFKVENPSAFWVYINKSGIIPSREHADFSIQPNSIFISPIINNNSLTVFCSGLDQTRGVPQITFSDATIGEASNVPFATSQFVSAFPNFPVTIPKSSIVAQNLPPVLLDKFQTVFIQMYATPDISDNNAAYYPQMIGVYDGGQLVDFTLRQSALGSFATIGGVVSYVPRSIPEIVTFRIDAIEPGFVGEAYDRTFNVIQSPDIIEYDYPAPYQIRGVPNAFTLKIIGSCIHPGYLIDLMYYQTSQAGGFNANIDIIVKQRNYGDIPNQSYDVYSTVLNNFMTINTAYAIQSKIILSGRVGIVEIFVTNNSGVGNGIIVEGAVRPV